MKPYPTITSYKQAVDVSESYATLKGVQIARRTNNDLHFASGNFATVFKAIKGRKQYALKCFLSSREDREERYHAIARHLKSIRSPYFIQYKYLPNELWVDDAEYPVVWMEWVKGRTLGACLKEACAQQDAPRLASITAKFKEMALWLLDQELAHGDLKHDNILVTSSGDMVLVDYDGMYVPALQGRTSSEIGGKGYQHPQRSGKDYHRDIDDFSILVIYTTLLALEKDPSLLEKYEAGNNLIIADVDLAQWPTSPVAKDLIRVGLSLWVTRIGEALQQQELKLPALKEWMLFSAADARLLQLEQQLREQQVAYGILERKLKENTQDYTRTAKELEERHAAYVALVREFEQECRTSQDLQGHLQSCNQDLKRLKASDNELRQQLNQLRAQNEQLKQFEQKFKQEAQGKITLQQQLEQAREREQMLEEALAQAIKANWFGRGLEWLGNKIGYTRKEKAKTHIILTLPGNVPLELILVKAGTFMMGSPNNDIDAGDNEKPQHQVTLTRDYYMGKYPITQAQWEAVMGENPSHFKGANRPVEQVFWNDIQEFLQKANGLLKAQGKLGLPTEAQWEYAARGGEKSKGYVYAGSNDIDQAAWYKGNSGGETHAVGEKHPNELGLYDMSGNVWEWCADWYGKYAAGATTDPVGPCIGIIRVLRGGSWNDYPLYCRAAYRLSFIPGIDPGYRRNCYGFRVGFFPV